MQLRKVVGPLLVLTVLLALSVAMSAQTATTGSVAGVVTDSTGAVITGAKVAVASDAGVRRETTTSDNGRYVFTLLAPGDYRMEVNATGFAVTRVEHIVVRITETTAADVKLSVGARQQEVNVSAQGSQVQTESSGKGTVIEQGQIRQLPLPTRNFQQLLTLTTGTSGALENSSELGRGDQAFYVNGQRSLSNNVQINGTDANSIGTGSTPNLAVPSIDSLQEFIVQTSLYDASQGRSAGSVVSAVTKSGTNQFHGDAYEFLRNTVLNANNFFLNREGVTRPKYNRNQFGVTLGGPVVKDRVWFFGSYQGTREVNGTSLSNSLATMLIPGNLGPQRDVASLIAFSASYPGSGGYIDPTALKILQATLPNGELVIPAVPGATTGVGLNTPVPVTIPSNSRFDEDQFNTNLDIKLTEKHRFAGKFFWADNTTDQALYNSFGDGNALQAPGWPVQQKLNQRVLSLDFSSVLSLTFLNDARFGWSTIFGPSKPAATNTASSLGINSPLASVYPAMPTLAFSNMFTSGPSPLAENFSEAKNYSAGDMMTWTHGRHIMKFGGEYRRQMLNAPYFHAFTQGEIYFLGFTGSPVSDFLDGISGLSVIGSGVDSVHNRANDFDFYYQDDWKATHNLTLNLGLRWDYFGPTTSTNGQFVAFDPTQAKTVPLGGGVIVTGGFVQAGNGNLPGIPKTYDGLVAPNYKNFGPRFGFAYQPFSTGKVVVRGGYGIYFDRPNMRAYNSQLFNMPYNMLATVIGTPLSDPFVHVPLPSQFPLNMTDPTYFPLGGYPAILPAAVAGGVAAVPATGIYPDQHHWGIPYVQQYNLGTQWSFANTWLLDLGYVGSVGRKFPRLWSFNQIPTPSPLSPGFSNLVAPGLGSFLVQSNSNSSYNSLQASLSKRLSKGLQMLVSYTFSHSMDDYSATNVSDITLTPGNLYDQNNYATSDFDRRQRFVASWVYDLPRFYRGNSGFAKQAVNGWELSGIATFQTGTPFSIVGSATAFSLTRGNLAPGRTLGSAVKSGSVESRLNAYFDTTAFVPPPAGQFGTLSRNVMRGPAQTNTDLAVVKFFPIHEAQKLEFRAEFFNLFNQVNFANPLSVVTAPAFGQIVATNTGPRVVQFALKYSF